MKNTDDGISLSLQSDGYHWQEENRQEVRDQVFCESL